jgi:hypothetical protein
MDFGVAGLALAAIMATEIISRANGAGGSQADHQMRSKTVCTATPRWGFLIGDVTTRRGLGLITI